MFKTTTALLLLGAASAISLQDCNECSVAKFVGEMQNKLDAQLDDNLPLEVNGDDDESTPTPVEQDPVEQDPVEQDPIEQDPIEQDPVEQDPVEQDPIEQDPIEQDPVEQDPAS